MLGHRHIDHEQGDEPREHAWATWPKRTVATATQTRSSSREVSTREPFCFSVVYFSRGTLPQEGVKGHYCATVAQRTWN